jgi:hypothetical protein
MKKQMTYLILPVVLFIIPIIAEIIILITTCKISITI